LDGMIDSQGLAAFRPGKRTLTTMNGRQFIAFCVGQTSVPFLPQCCPAERGTLLFAGFGPEFRLAVRIGDAFLFCYFLDQGSTPREAFQHILRYAFDLEIVALTLNPEADVLEPVGQPDTECRLEVRGIPLDVGELTGFPAAFLLVPGR